MYFHSHEPNEPPHVHVDRDDQSAKFWLIPVALAGNLGFSPVELRKIQRMLKVMVDSGLALPGIDPTAWLRFTAILNTDCDYRLRESEA